MSTSPHKSILCPISANHFILHAQVAAISTSPLPNTSLLNDSQHTAGKRPSLPSRCPFSPPKRPEQRRKRTPYVFNSLLLPPIEVAAMSTSPHASTLCPMLPNHFILHAKSLARLALRAPPNPEAGFRFLPSQVYIHIYIYIVNPARWEAIEFLLFWWTIACKKGFVGSFRSWKDTPLVNYKENVDFEV